MHLGYDRRRVAVTGPSIGDFFVSNSFSGAGGPIANLQTKAVQWVTESDVNHAGIYTGAGQVVEAMPGGTRYAPLSNYQADGRVIWSNGYGLIDLRGQEHTDARHRIASFAVQMIGTPYGWLDIAAIALAQRRLGSRISVRKPAAEQPWWVRRAVDPASVICSALVALAYAHAGVQLYVDGWLPQLVSPGDLHRLLREEVRPG